MLLINPYTEEKYRVNAESDATVRDVKLALKELTGQPITRMRFVWKGQILYDNERIPQIGTVYYIPLSRPDNFGEVNPLRLHSKYRM